ncbi:MAG: hypothetical protein HY291_01005 [Planctomycetes bacterium]|nr:hypothetical protein [Planctomycetota bacterium]
MPNMKVCSECKEPFGQEIGDRDVDHLGNEMHLRVPLGSEGVAKAILLPLGIMLAKGVAKGYFKNKYFCAVCRANAKPIRDPYLWANLFSGLGFLTFFLFLFAPIGWIFFAAAILCLRFRLRRFNAEPKASEVPYAVNALGLFTVSVMLHTLILVVIAFVMMQLMRDPGFKW